MRRICARAQETHLGVKAAPSKGCIYRYTYTPHRERICWNFSSAGVMDMDSNPTATQEPVCGLFLEAAPQQ